MAVVCLVHAIRNLFSIIGRMLQIILLVVINWHKPKFQPLYEIGGIRNEWTYSNSKSEPDKVWPNISELHLQTYIKHHEDISTNLGKGRNLYGESS